ncbi:glycine dehydrogenase domain protein [Burkholderia pseudomallei]|nr:glycine dehydrogenase domain protein [Burkholderia pseudomallei]
MYERNTWFLSASARSAASASASLFGCANGPSGSVSARRIDAGITASISAARVAKPSVSSMACWLAASGPIWRSANASCVSSAASERGVRFIRRSGCSSFMAVLCRPELAL